MAGQGLGFYIAKVIESLWLEDEMRGRPRRPLRTKDITSPRVGTKNTREIKTEVYGIRPTHTMYESAMSKLNDARKILEDRYTDAVVLPVTDFFFSKRFPKGDAPIPEEAARRAIPGGRGLKTAGILYVEKGDARLAPLLAVYVQRNNANAAGKARTNLDRDLRGWAKGVVTAPEVAARRVAFEGQTLLPTPGDVEKSIGRKRGEIGS